MASLRKLPRELLFDIAERIRADAPVRANITAWDERHAQNQKALISLSCVCKGFRDSLFNKVFHSVVISSPGALQSLLCLLRDRPEIRENILRLRLRVLPSTNRGEPTMDLQEMRAIKTWVGTWGFEPTLNFMDDDAIRRSWCKGWKYDPVDEACTGFACALLLCLLPGIRDIFLSTSDELIRETYSQLSDRARCLLSEATAGRDGSSGSEDDRQCIMPALSSLVVSQLERFDRLDVKNCVQSTWAKAAMGPAVFAKAVSEVHVDTLCLHTNNFERASSVVNFDHISRLSLVDVSFSDGADGFAEFVGRFKNLTTFMYFLSSPWRRNEIPWQSTYIAPKDVIRRLGEISKGIRTLCLRVFGGCQEGLGWEDDFGIESLEDFASLENLYIDAEALVVFEQLEPSYLLGDDDRYDDGDDEYDDDKEDKDQKRREHDDRLLFCYCDDERYSDDHRALFRCRAIDTLPPSVKRLHLPGPRSGYYQGDNVKLVEHSLSRLATSPRPGMALEELVAACCRHWKCKPDLAAFKKAGIQAGSGSAVDRHPELW
ncbi:hypothetical protein CSOJ01_11917 [Colletotrichum sojae]|uniref:Uncharacterized protein n=1 Tax=Colletotrichum sojae TaxID=2175907 RepID=A0A8H6IW97_9PEZI|nr:hypothetical protein CSOJ01_11917 [Colletotrichum sojae]